MRKDIEITLRHKRSGLVKTYFCHHYSANSSYYHLQGVKDHKDPLNIGMCFPKTEWERI